MSHPSVNENSKANSNPKKWKSDRAGKENNDVEYTSFRNKIIETFEKTEAISMSESGNLTKVKIKKSQEKCLNFPNLAIQEFCDDIELDMMMLRQCCMLLQKQLNLYLELKRKRKENLTKTKSQSGELILKMKLKRWEERCQYLAKARKVISKYKITSAIDIPSIKEELK